MLDTSRTRTSSGFYTAAAIAAIVFVCLIVIDIVASILAGEAPAPGTLSAVDAFGMLRATPLRAFQYLGVINLVEQFLMLWVVYGFYVSHRDAFRNASLIALVLFALGLGIYLANNAALPLFFLSQKHAAADDSTRQYLAAAGEALLARGEDFTPGSLPGFLLNEIGALVMLLTMLKAGIFRTVPSIIGVVGVLCLTAFTIGVALSPRLYNPLMALSMVGGLLMLAWYVMTALRFLKISSPRP